MLREDVVGVTFWSEPFLQNKTPIYSVLLEDDV